MEDLIDFDPDQGSAIESEMSGLDEDLFGDLEPLALDIGEPPPVMSFEPANRLEELGMTSCCQKIAWSRTGCIAYVTRNGAGVKLQTYPLGPRSRSQVLETDSVHLDRDIVHVTWDPTGQCLAIVDITGRISIHRAFGASNQMSKMGKYLPVKGSLCNTVIGTHWIGSNARPTVDTTIVEAHIKDGKTSYSTRNTAPDGIRHPFQDREALFVVTEDGLLHLLFAQDHPDANGLYTEINTPLFLAATAEDLLTHACFVADRDNFMLLCTYDASQRLRVYRASVNWHEKTSARGRPIAHQLSPTLESHPLDVLSLADITDARLTDICIVPSLDGAKVESPSTVEIYALFTNSNARSRFQRVLLKELDSSQDKLLPAFKKAVGGNTRLHEPDSTNHYKLVKDISVNLHDTCLYLRSIGGHTGLQILHHDGTSEIRSGRSIATRELAAGGNESQAIRYLSNGGLEFELAESRVDITLSPNLCIIMARTTDNMTGDVVLVERRLAAPGQDSDYSHVALAATIASTYQREHNDDIYSLVKVLHEAGRLSIKQLLDELFNALLSNEPRFSSDPSRLLPPNGISRAIVFMYHISSISPEDGTCLRTAWMLLELIHVAVFLTSAWEALRRQESSNPGVDIPSHTFALLAGHVRTLVHIVGEILKASRADIVTSNDRLSPALRLVLCGFPRLIIRMIHRVIATLFRFQTEAFSQKAGIDPRVSEAWLMWRNTLVKAPLSIQAVDAYMIKLEADTAKKYTDAGLDDAARAKDETNMLLHGVVPDILKGIFINATNPSSDIFAILGKHIFDASRFFYADDYWLWHSEDRRTAEKGSDRYWIDVARKTSLMDAGNLRTCTSCGACSEDPASKKLPHWVLVLARNCICGGAWTVGEF